jgi:DNA-binding LacI/PurR family transcriptional regulator
MKTVSNVINDRPYVSAETRERVEQAVRQLGYRPNLSARALRSGRTGVIALAIPRLDLPYFAEVAHSIVRAASKRGWTVFIDETGGDPRLELAAIRGLGPHQIDGLIFSPLALSSAEITNQPMPGPIVMLGERCLDGTTDHVVIDNVAAARIATTHLIAIGRTRIAAIGDQPYVPTNTARLRLAGYRTALADAGLAAHPDLVQSPEGFTRDEGARLMSKLLRLPEPPDAVFCFNDLLAIGAMRAIHQRGLRVPEDIAVVGFDDIDEGRYSNPTLSTIAPDKDQLGEMAVSLIERRLAGYSLDESSDASRAESAQQKTIEFELRIRESTGGHN